MGWWGWGVMEGDEPCDLQYIIEQSLASGVGALDGQSDSEYEAEEIRVNDVSRAKLKAGDYMDIVAQIKDGTLTDWGDSNIALQVLGEMIMVYGGKMDEALKPMFIEAAESDDWAEREVKRKAEMTAFINRVIAYDGTAIEPTSRGLFDTIFTAIENGEEGLVNK